jgi:peptidoglycan L-alanyl-D-glutamate endopeptidase CwlK
MTFKLSSRSLGRLDGVDEKLSNVVKKAIGYSTVDFGVIQGLRSVEEQKELVARGLSKTMKSKHLEGRAVDLMAYLNGRACWEINVYDEIADAMKQAAIEEDVHIRWGAAWTVSDIRSWEGTMEEAMLHYVDIRRGQNKRPFIDGPH